MRSTWSSIEDWLKLNAPKVIASFDPPASDADIEALQARLKRPVPPELIELLKIHNGQNTRLGSINGWYLLPVDEIAECHEINGNLMKAGDFKRNKAENEDGKVKAEWWNENWIPFMEGPGGDLLCIDMDPTPNGSVGQIITWWHADGDRNVEDPTLKEYLAGSLSDLRDGVFKVNAKGGLSLT